MRAQRGPRGIARTAADAAHLPKPWRTQFRQPRVCQRLDAGDPFQQSVQERRVVRGAGGFAGRVCRIGDREPLARGGEGVIIESAVPSRVDRGTESYEVIRAEMPRQRPAAAVGSAAGQPLPAQPVAVDAELRRKHRLVRQQLDRQRRAERGDARAGLRGAGRQERGAAVGGPGDDLGRARQAEARGRFLHDRRHHRSRFDDGRQHGAADADIGKPGRPASRDWVVAGLQRVILVGHGKPPAQSPCDPVGLMQHMRDAERGLHDQQLGEWGGGAVRRALRRRECGHSPDHRRVGRVVVEARRPDRHAGQIDGQHGAGRAIDRDRPHPGQVGAGAQAVERLRHRQPPRLRRAAQIGGQRRRAPGERRASRVDQGRANAGGADIDPDRDARAHANSVKESSRGMKKKQFT